MPRKKKTEDQSFAAPEPSVVIVDPAEVMPSPSSKAPAAAKPEAPTEKKTTPIRFPVTKDIERGVVVGSVDDVVALIKEMASAPDGQYRPMTAHVTESVKGTAMTEGGELVYEPAGGSTLKLTFALPKDNPKKAS